MRNSAASHDEPPDEAQAQLAARDWKCFASIDEVGLAALVAVYTHVLLQVVGYDLSSQPPYWLCKNSWSTNFAAGELDWP
jgi:hypothetical protein